MILLLSDPPLDEAGAKRLHPTRRRIRRQTRRTLFFAPLNRDELSPIPVLAALPFSKRRRLRIPGLKSEPMYNRGKLSSFLFAASRSGMCTFSLATAVSGFPHAKPQTPSTFFLKEKPTCEAWAGNRELQIRSGRNSVSIAVSLGTASAAEAHRKKPLTPVRVPNEACSYRVARQPQQPVVQALKRI